MIVLPAMSWVSAPAGTATLAPAATILPSRTTRVPRSTAGPLMGIRRTLTNAWVVCATATPAVAADTARLAASSFNMNESLSEKLRLSLPSLEL